MQKIRLLSYFFVPTTKETPTDVVTKSHAYSMRAGLINQLASGLYSWLPTGLRVLKKIQEIVHEEMERAGAQEIMMPIVQPADLWKQSGRYDDYGQEMIRFLDRGERELLLAPTHEEVATDIFRQKIKSYKELPQHWYHIQWKFRDEIRPRFGLMRAREFLMKDSYSFDIDQESSAITYNKMYVAYYRIFARMGLRCVPALTTDTGPIGGSMSHEFHVVAPTGENSICYDARFDSMPPSELVEILHTNKLYGVMEEIYNESEVGGIQISRAKSIEVGHIFHFGQKYSKTMGASVVDAQGNKQYVYMGSYGVGVSRLVGAIIEASHDDSGIIWPPSVAPFTAHVIDLIGDEAARSVICNALDNANIETLYDDTDDSAGVKFSRADLMGMPWQLIIGKFYKEGKLELKNRSTGKRSVATIEECIHIIEQHNATCGAL